MNRKITILGNSAAGAAAAAVLSKHNTVTVTMDPADCADAEYVLVACKTKFSKLKMNYDTAAIEKALPEVVFVGIHDPAAIARTPGCTPAIMRQVIDKLLASGPDTTVYIYDPRGEGAAMGLTDGCRVIEDAAFFRKNSDVILAPAAAREELAEVAGKVYCREIEL